MLIRPLNENDLPQVAILHKLAFPESALSKLGKDTILRYYRYQLLGPHESYCIGAFLNNNLTGFCFAGLFLNAEVGFIKKNSLFLIGSLLTHPWFLFNEIIIRRIDYVIHEIIRFLKKSKKDKQPKKLNISKYGILSIAVHPDYQRRNIGKKLMEEVELDAKEKGSKKIRLTVHPNNQKAIIFYEKNGWKKISFNNNWEGYMEKELF